MSKLFENVIYQLPNDDGHSIVVIGCLPNGRTKKISEIICGSGIIVWENEYLKRDDLYRSQIQTVIEFAKNLETRNGQELDALCDEIALAEAELNKRKELLKLRLQDEYGFEISSAEMARVAKDGHSGLTEILREKF